MTKSCDFELKIGMHFPVLHTFVPMVENASEKEAHLWLLFWLFCYHFIWIFYSKAESNNRIYLFESVYLSSDIMWNTE